MRALLIASLTLVAVAAIGAQTATPDPAAILGATREALGGDRRLSAVKTFDRDRAHAAGPRRQPCAD